MVTPASASDSDAAVTAAADALYGVPLGSFVAERKRLADERKAAGDKAAAAAIAKLARPAMSAWVVNRLWRDAREDMDGLLAAGARVKAGERAQLEVQRTHLARLRAKAAAVLVGDGHAAAPATLQRIATTLQALSALGTWAPDRPGQLIADRDPPGFDVLVGSVIGGSGPIARARTEPALVPERDDARDGGGAGGRDRAAERRARAAERARIRAGERAALAQAAAAAARELEEKTALRDRARVEVEAAETTLARARARLATAEAAQDEAADRAGRADAALAAHDLDGERADDDDDDDDGDDED